MTETPTNKPSADKSPADKTPARQSSKKSAEKPKVQKPAADAKAATKTTTAPVAKMDDNPAAEAKVTIEWLNEEKQTVLVTYLRDGWTWDDFHRVVDEQYKLVASVAYVVDILVDVRNTHWMPKGGSLASGIRKINNAHERQGHTVIVGASGVIAIIARSLLKLLGNRQKFHFVDTLDEATTLLASLRERRVSAA